ncbi:MAG: hypothetical protein KGR26_12255 [Cyanobacteria bacterium REEB65]|nr:hypothetical protein [Cyanobacteria bacterium REEB65]
MADFASFNFDPFQTDYSFSPDAPALESDVAGPPTLGVLLIEMGALALEKLEEAIRIQREQGSPLAQVLLEGGYCTQDQVIAALRSRPNYG